MQYAVKTLRVLGALEGISFLVLLGVAMPLKYVAGIPLAVRVVGTAHGILFILYLVAVAQVAYRNRWSFKRIVEAIVAALYPFGTFLFDRKLRDEILTTTNSSRPS